MNARTIEYPLIGKRSSAEMRILSWNVYYSNKKKHGDDVIKALEKFDCDVLLLHEVNLDLRLPERIHELGYGGVFAEMNYLKRFRPISGGVAFFSRFPMRKIRIVETISDSRFRVRRYYIEARVVASRASSIVIGMTHNALPFEKGFREACDALQDEISRHSKQFLFAGDLNALPRFKLVKQLRNRLVNLGPPLHLPSYPTRRWVRVTPPRRIDYAFGTEDVAKMLVEEAQFGESHPSDHRPILIHLRMRK